MNNPDLKFPEITSKIIGCAMTVHNKLGCGFQEVIYQRALAIEFDSARLEYARELEMIIYYNEKEIGNRRVDFFVAGKIMVELKAISQLEKVHLTQALNYAEAYHMEVALLINFGEQSLKFHRINNNKVRTGIIGK